MPRLFTYIIPIDDGAAPNPFGGMCTLNICKPGIRRVANEGDWIAAFGSKKAPGGDLSGKLVYAMKVTKVLPMQDYDTFSRKNCPQKIPNFASKNWNDRLGDAIYDFKTSPPKQRLGVHLPGNQRTDLSGSNCLLSEHFVYFGSNPIPCPIKAIIYQGQGHRSRKNAPYAADFVQWIEAIIANGKPMRGVPDYKIDWIMGCGSGCRVRQDEIDDEEI